MSWSIANHLWHRNDRDAVSDRGLPAWMPSASVTRKTEGALPRFAKATFRCGYTLVEVLVVMFIFLLLAAVALPRVRALISDGKGTRAASGFASYIDTVRSRAISEGRHMGIRIERIVPVVDGYDDYGSSASIRIRQISGVPPYSGESADAHGVLRDIDTTIPGVDSIELSSRDNQLLALSATMIGSGEANPPVQIGDLLELPGGRTVPITGISVSPPMTDPTSTVFLTFNLRNAIDVATSASTFEFPSSTRSYGVGESIRYLIHRSPAVSSTAPFDLPKGIAVDLNYSGIGVDGNQFAAGTSAYSPIDLIFGIDGKVEYVNGSDGLVRSPTGLIFLCLGETDGIRRDDLFSTENRATANLLNLDSSWIVINPNTGSVSVSPFATVSSLPTGVVTDPTDVSLDVALAQARSLALLSDTKEAN
ncbi:pilus assembly FimT family protein [Novipirellula artificiosorum]|uniref:Uncharacterized protein n=1 Tax=Novipirellula artificiosorum TaxID=2528016 RepID=A0A5C6D9D6_9BACT|nr:type II secretion system protein [Novipirellula artificiosorum]TWU33753.1 hypothetical protein Poly41_47500 [Novipirellula artificiosorum]